MPREPSHSGCVAGPDPWREIPQYNIKIEDFRPSLNIVRFKGFEEIIITKVDFVLREQGELYHLETRRNELF